MPMQFPFPNVFALGLVGLEERVHRDYRQILCDYDRSAVGAPRSLVIVPRYL